MGVDYVGVDVPVVVEELTEKLGDVAKGEKHPHYMAGDVTNAASLKQAADQLEGEIFISCEGLLSYLSDIELREMLKGVRQILLEHGGVWYTSDPTNFYGEAVPVVASNTNLLQELGSFTQGLRSEKDIFADSTDMTDAEAVRKLFEECGFKVEKVPYYSDEFPIRILDSYPAELKERFLELLNNMEGWKMTPVDEAVVEEGPAESTSVDHLELKYQVTGNRLTITPVGRIDTLTALEFLKVYDESKEKHNLAEVVVDGTDLIYISSTGLRTLMMMVKDLGVGNVRLQNPQPMIVEILNDSGFADVVVVE